ncbi:rab-GTPase-TBC domain-containing protein [Syncephalis plumigaleata]|nr:rab-GTPase-TBC domain-containing protein [Syncephalis plumigaleata]
MARNELEEFEDILSAEVLVDMEKLRDMARSGVPNTIRGVVWRYLLGVESADRSREQSDSRRHIEEYEQLDKENMEISKRVRGDVQRYQRRLAAVNAGYSVNTLTNNAKEHTTAGSSISASSSSSSSSNLSANNDSQNNGNSSSNQHGQREDHITQHNNNNNTDATATATNNSSNSNSASHTDTNQTNHLAEQLANFAQQHDWPRNKHVEYSPALVSLCMPFVFVCQEESDMYHCFSQLMRMLEDYLDEQGIRERMANFMTLFRALIPDLHNYFVEEEVDVNEWATSWLQFLLSKELPLPCLLRLWDIYFSLDGKLENHVYVCLALLRHYKDALEELEQSEIRTLLLRMPILDINEVIHQALNIRSEILQRQVSDSL